MKEQKKLSNGIENSSPDRSDNSCGHKNKSSKNKKILFIFAIAALLVLFDIIIGIRLIDTKRTTNNWTVEKHFDKESFIRRSLDDPEQYPIGSCTELDGTTLVISIFADDPADKWDFTDPKDEKTVEMMYEHLARAFSWIKEKGKSYGKNIDFVYDFHKYPDLAYTDTLEIEFTDGYRHAEVQKTALLRSNWNTKGIELMDKYDADNIMFIYYFNKKKDTKMIPGASPYITGSKRYTDYPLETILLTPYSAGVEQGSATYAHEILHLFGAPDLYVEDTDGTNYGITKEFVDYCRLHHKNEIMVSMYDIYTLLPDPNSITNDLTDLTAYYIGWIDNNQECEAYNVTTSEHADR